jgi:hypothetical protein
MKTQGYGLCARHFMELDNRRPKSSAFLIFCMLPILFRSFLVHLFLTISSILSVWIILGSINSMSTDLLTIMHLKFCHSSNSESVTLFILATCHCLGMRTNCQHQVAAATAPLSGTASLTICVSFMTLVSVTALVATPLLSPLVTGHGILVIGMLTTPLLVFDHHYSLLPCFGSEVEPPFCSYCLVSSIVSAKWLHTYLVLLLDDSYCLHVAIVSSYLLSCVPLRTGPLLLLSEGTILPSTYGSISSTCTSIGTL